MPYFKCTLVNEKGRYRSSEYYAENKKEIEASLGNLEEKLMRVQRLWFRNFSLKKIFKRKIGYTEFLLFNQEMIALLKAGIPVIRALEIITQNTRSGILREIIAKASGNIRNGMQISEAFSSAQIPFHKIYKASLMAGEKSGHLEQILEKFNIYLGKISNLRRKMVSSLTYPIILLLFMISMVLVIAIFVIPKFSAFFDNMDAQLPAMTLFFIASTQYLKENIVLFLAAAALIYAAVRAIEHFNPRVIIIDQAKIKIPFLGRIIHENAIAVFARTLAILISGGIPVPESAEIAVETFANKFYYSQVRDIPEKIRQGNLLSGVLEEIAIIPRILVEMIRVGETSGNLTAVLDESAEYYERSIDSKINALISLIEPVIIILLGMVIAVMLISVYLPIFTSIRVIQ
ncbi:MAG: type II secretion system F family protein [Acidobacteria bacterium]|nr:type II secretion system F family protein [Acidobacteriota bacterium]MBU4306971.1 type II secretion system F family protein [Acidobacteriota bacterium]MBU4405625.1 type II secretion system F family protein [Acidobacteriota bacterium]MCG2812166.1 type II secretion system F family protein [Candidatus Aminicenantes bacterium]